MELKNLQERFILRAQRELYSKLMRKAFLRRYVFLYFFYSRIILTHAWYLIQMRIKCKVKLIYSWNMLYPNSLSHWKKNNKVETTYKFCFLNSKKFTFSQSIQQRC